MGGPHEAQGGLLMSINLLSLLQSKTTDTSLKLDVGANIGGYAFLMLDHPGRIHAFEPIPQLAQEVARRFADEPRVEVFECGVSNHEFVDSGYAVFEAWTLDKPGRAVRGRNAESLERFGEQTFTIAFVTIDMHLGRQGRPRVDFIKLDTDGYEFRVLKGAQQTLLRDRPTLLMEFNYMVADIGDSIPEMLWWIYKKLHYVVLTADGEVRDHDYWLTHYPMNTTFDVGLIPAERLQEFAL